MTQKITIKHDDFGVIEIEKSGAISIEWHGNIMKVVSSQEVDGRVEYNVLAKLDGNKVPEWFIQDMELLNQRDQLNHWQVINETYKSMDELMQDMKNG